MNINGKLAPIMLTKSPPLQMRECSLVRNAGRRAHAGNHAAGAHVVSKGDESAEKLLHTLLWNILGMKAGNKPENCRICMGASVRRSGVERRTTKSFRIWRRKRDSNPRAPSDANGFQDRRLQPLGHSSSNYPSRLLVRFATHML
jgi:hypothetical protein